MAMRMRKYAVHADYAHICEYADVDENLIHIIHTYLPKIAIFCAKHYRTHTGPSKPRIISDLNISWSNASGATL